MHVTDDENVLSKERLSFDVVEVERDKREHVGHIPADDAGELVVCRAMLMRSVFLGPAGKWQVVDVGIRTVVQD